jgi:ATP-dependent helicase/DNAse subunit B
MIEPPLHRSYSQMSTFKTCAWKYYLQKVAVLPEQPAVYTAVGSAIHEVIEKINHDYFESKQHVR